MKQNWLNDNIKPILALIVVILGFSYFYMCSIRNIKPDPQILIAIVASISGATGYYFGSSQGTNKKDEAIASMATGTSVVNNADNVTVEAKK